MAKKRGKKWIYLHFSKTKTKSHFDKQLKSLKKRGYEIKFVKSKKSIFGKGYKVFARKSSKK